MLVNTTAAHLTPPALSPNLPALNSLDEEINNCGATLVIIYTCTCPVTNSHHSELSQITDGIGSSTGERHLFSSHPGQIIARELANSYFIHGSRRKILLGSFR